MKIALFGQYYQNSTAETVQKVVSFLESKEIKIAFEAHFLAILKEKNIVSKNYETYSCHKTLNNDFRGIAHNLANEKGVPDNLIYRLSLFLLQEQEIELKESLKSQSYEKPETFPFTTERLNSFKQEAA